MELLVLGVLDWRLRSVTPFSFLAFFACKIDSTGEYIGFLISRATEIILSNMQGNNDVDIHACVNGVFEIIFFFFFFWDQQKRAFWSIGPQALPLQLYFVQPMKCQTCLLLILNTQNHGVMD